MRRALILLLPLLFVLASLAQQPATPASFKTIYVNSETIYLKSDLMRQELEHTPEFGKWGLKLALTRGEADTMLEIHRPFLTFDWEYKLVNLKTNQELASGTVVASEGHRAAIRIAEELMGKLAPVFTTVPQSPAEIMRTFRNVYVESQTIYMKSELIQTALRAQPGFQLLGLNLVASPRDADITINIHRPFMTFDWEYRMRHPASGRDLGSGTVVAWDGATAAPQLAALIMTAIGAARPLAAVQQPAGNRPEAPEWRVTRLQGPDLSPDANVGLKLAEGRIVASGGTTSLAIPVASVVAIAYDRTPRGVGYWADRDQFFLVPVAASQTTAAGDGHYVIIGWLDAGRLRQLELQVAPNDCDPMLSQLQTATARPSLRVPAEREALLKTIQHQGSEAVTVDFDRSIRVGWSEVAPGSYRVVLVPRSAGLSELYLLPASGEQRVVAQALVETAERKTGTTVQVTYKEENGLAHISELRTPAAVLRFTPVPVVASE